MADQKTKCARPACTRAAHANHGYCEVHAPVLGVEDPMIDSESTLRDVEELLRTGWTFYAIGAVTGLSRHGIKRMHDNQHEHVRASTRDKIAAIRGKQPPSKQPAWPIQRRLQSLQAAGFTQDQIARGVGFSQSTLSKIMSGTRPPTHVAAAVAQFYDEHKHDQVRRPARASKGNPWPTPMWWNDIDDENEQPGVNVCLSCHADKEPNKSFYCPTCAKRISHAKRTERERQKRKAAR